MSLAAMISVSVILSIGDVAAIKDPVTYPTCAVLGEYPHLNVHITSRDCACYGASGEMDKAIKGESTISTTHQVT